MSHKYLQIKTQETQQNQVFIYTPVIQNHKQKNTDGTK